MRFLKKFKRYLRAKPSDEELDGIKNYLAGIFVLRNSSRSAIINQLAFMERHQLNENYLNDYVARIYDVTAEDISDMAKKYLTAETMTLVVVGVKGTVEPQLKAVEAIKSLLVVISKVRQIKSTCNYSAFLVLQ